MLSVFLLSFETNTKESIFSCEMFLKAEDGVVYSSPPDRPDIEKKSKLAPHFRLEIGSCPTRSRDYPWGRCAVTKISYPALAVILGTLTILAQVASCYLVAHKPSTPRPNAFRIFFQTPKVAKNILVILVRPLTRLKHKIQNLPLSLPGRAHANLVYEFILPP